MLQTVWLTEIAKGMARGAAEVDVKTSDSKCECAAIKPLVRLLPASGLQNNTVKFCSSSTSQPAAVETAAKSLTKSVVE